MIREFNTKDLTEHDVLAREDISWLLKRMLTNPEKPQFNFVVDFNGEQRSINIARFGELYRILTQPANRHYGDKDVLLGISQVLFGEYIGPQGLTYGTNGSWDKLNQFELAVEGDAACLVANYSLVTYDRKERHPDHPDDQIVTWIAPEINMWQRVMLMNLIGAYSTNTMVPFAQAHLDYVMKVDVIGKKVDFNFTSDGAPEVINHDEAK